MSNLNIGRMSDIVTNYNQTAGSQFVSSKNNNFNADVKTIYDGLIEKVAARINLSSNQSVANNTVTPIVNYNTASPEFNEGNLLAITDNRTFTPSGGSSTTADTILVPDAGLYLIQANCRWGTNSAGFRRVEIRSCTFNGVSYGTQRSLLIDDRGNNSNTLFQSMSTICKLSANDIIWVTAFQNSGGVLNFEKSGSVNDNFLQIVKLSK